MMEINKILSGHLNAHLTDLQIGFDKNNGKKDGIFNAIVENSLAFISIILEEKIVYINSTGLHMIGYKTSIEVAGRSIFEIIHPDNHIAVLDQIKNSNVNAPTNQLIIKLLKADGAYIDTEIGIMSFIYDDKPATLLICRNITDELESNRIARKEEKLRTDILNSFTELIAFYEPDHRIRWLNNAAKRQLGIDDDSYIGKHCYGVWYNSSIPCSGCPVVSRNRESCERITTRCDNRSWLVRHSPLVDSNNLIIGYIEFSADITDKLEQERLRRQLAADALYINQKNKITLEIKAELDKIIGSNTNYSSKTFQKIYDIIGSYARFDEDWELLKTHFEQIHPDFFTQLEHRFPNLSVNDIRHCACIKLNFDTKETARFFNVKPDSIQMSRVRLKKKMKLAKSADLRNFILNF